VLHKGKKLKHMARKSLAKKKKKTGGTNKKEKTEKLKNQNGSLSGRGRNPTSRGIVGVKNNTTCGKRTSCRQW